MLPWRGGGGGGRGRFGGGGGGGGEFGQGRLSGGPGGLPYGGGAGLRHESLRSPPPKSPPPELSLTPPCEPPFQTLLSDTSGFAKGWAKPDNGSRSMQKQDKTILVEAQRVFMAAPPSPVNRPKQTTLCIITLNDVSLRILYLPREKSNILSVPQQGLNDRKFESVHARQPALIPDGGGFRRLAPKVWAGVAAQWPIPEIRDIRG